MKKKKEAPEKIQHTQVHWKEKLKFQGNFSMFVFGRRPRF